MALVGLPGCWEQVSVEWFPQMKWQKAVQALLTRADDYPGDYRSPLAFVRAAAIQEEQLSDRQAAIVELRAPDVGGIDGTRLCACR